MFLLDPSNAVLGSWLDEQEEPWGIGCKACCSAGCAGGQAQYSVVTEHGLQKINFEKHAKSKGHHEAVRKYLLAAVSAAAGSTSTTVAPGTSPDQAAFKDVWEGAKKGEPLNGQKNVSMVFCLAEAMKSIDQKRLAQAAEIGIFRDERKGRILIRYRVVTEDLEIWSGMLGQERDAGTGAQNLTRATEKIAKRFCSRWVGAQSDKQKQFLKTGLLRHVLDKITTLTVDSAADELVSGEIMRTALTPDQKVLCPNLRNVIRDKAHSSRRLTSRPWSADDELVEVMNFFCGGRGSVARMIQHSPEIRRMFESFASTGDNVLDKAVVNFRSAQHRFESHTKPLGRTCLFLHACIRTCLQLVRTRKDSTGQKAKAWVENLDEEKALLAAMMADAADSSLQLTRKMDSEEVDPATMSNDIALYLQEIQALFVHGEVLHRFGYTTTMLETLKKPLVFQCGATTKCFGSHSGVSDALQQKCLKRLQLWVKLASAALQAEFPCFELGQAFRVFNLETGSSDSSKDLQRIAHTCGLNGQALEHQWRDLMPRAKSHLQMNPLSQEYKGRNRLAWQKTLQQVNTNPVLKACHPSGELRQALVAYFVYGGSSSGVEQAFSKNAWICYSRRNAMRPDTEEMIEKIAADSGNYDEEQILHLAQVVWSACYGRPREHVTSRIDKGLKRPLLDEDMDKDSFGGTEIGFIRKRRKEAASAASVWNSAASAGSEDTMADSAMWTEKHDRELAFQQQKAQARLVHAFSENSLLPEECTSDLREAKDACDQTLKKNEAERERLRLNANKSGFSREEFLNQIAGSSVFLAVSATDALRAACVQCNLHICKNAKEADVIVCNEPGRMTDVKLQLVSALNGCYEVSPGLLLGSKGCALKLFNAACVQRALLVSPGSRSESSQFWSFLRSSLPSVHSWLLHAVAVDDLLREQARFKSGVAFVIVNDKEAKNFPNAKNCYTLQTFLQRIRRVDTKKSVTGLSGVDKCAGR